METTIKIHLKHAHALTDNPAQIACHKVTTGTKVKADQRGWLS